jgi:hypothetical protein
MASTNKLLSSVISDFSGTTGTKSKVFYHPLATAMCYRDVKKKGCNLKYVRTYSVDLIARLSNLGNGRSCRISILRNRREVVQLPHDGRRGDLVVERLSVKMEIGGEDLSSMLLTFYLRRRRCGEIS